MASGKGTTVERLESLPWHGASDDWDPKDLKVQPKGVSLIAFGHKKSPFVRKSLVDEGYIIADEVTFDLRDWLADPLDELRVERGSNGTNSKTQLAVPDPNLMPSFKG